MNKITLNTAFNILNIFNACQTTPTNNNSNKINVTHKINKNKQYLQKIITPPKTINLYE